MKKIISFLIIILVQTLNLKAEDFKLNQIISGLKSPWSLTFKNQNEILLTEKSGQILFVNLNISNNLPLTPSPLIESKFIYIVFVPGISSPLLVWSQVQYTSLQAIHWMFS